MSDGTSTIDPALELSSEHAALAFVTRCFSSTEDLYLRPGVALTPATRLREDLGIDSIGRVSLFYTLLDKLGVSEDDVPGGDQSAAALESVGDLIAFARTVATAERAR